MRFSEDYEKHLEACRRHHAASKTFSGTGLIRLLPALMDLLGDGRVYDVLDYGSGKGRQWELKFPYPMPDGPVTSLSGLLGSPVVRMYDPGYPPHAIPVSLEDRFDLVICTNTLGLVPERDLPIVVRDLYRHARKYLFMSINLAPAKKDIGGIQACPNPEYWSELLYRYELEYPKVRVRAIIEKEPDVFRLPR